MGMFRINYVLDPLSNPFLRWQIHTIGFVRFLITLVSQGVLELHQQGFA